MKPDMKIFDSLKILILSVLLLSGGMSLYGQSTHFQNVFKACCMATSSMEHKDGSKGVLVEATNLLTDAEWTPLILQNEDVAGEADIKSHMVFSPAFLKELQNGRKVFEWAEKYAAQAESLQRGGSVMLCTKCIGPKDEVTYSLRGIPGKMYVGAVAEVNGLMNLYVKVIDADMRETIYKENSDEFKGASHRCLELNLPDGFSAVYITIENKSPFAKSVALIIE
ncbi:MAG: hypothetical protein ACI3ZL_06435 [Candidatus Cryptobacteroides sp.]